MPTTPEAPGRAGDADSAPDAGHDAADPTAAPPDPTAAPPGRTPFRRWAADLILGFRIAAAGGREGWVRTALTAVGVGLGVALLLLAAAIPNMISAQQERNDARADYVFEELPPGDGTVLMARADSDYQDHRVRGRLLQPGGDPAQAPVPPGLSDGLPGPGETLVSPALQDRLDAEPDGLLAERVPGEVTGTIDAEGLSHGGELAFYSGTDDLEPGAGGVTVLDSFGASEPDDGALDAILLLLVVAVCAILLLPVGVFVATAVRLGGQRRDERLAALRLLGTDGPMTRRIASGEALLGALVGLLVGAVLFAVGRQLLGSVTVMNVGFYPDDLVPQPLITALVVLGVPAAAVLITLQAMRRVTVEPLGVSRTATVRRRRLWWRLLVPAVGLALLAPSVAGDFDHGGETLTTARIAAGIVLVLVGVTAVLPWLVEWTVRRLNGGPVSVQLATRRLQQDSGPPSRAISGITVAVAGAITLQMFLAGIEDDYLIAGESGRGGDVTTQFTASGLDAMEAYLADLGETAGVTDVGGSTSIAVGTPGGHVWNSARIGDCAALSDLEQVTLDGCRDGDVFVVRPTGEWRGEEVEFAPGLELDLNPPMDENTPHDPAEQVAEPLLWTVPDDAAVVERENVDEEMSAGGVLLVTPGALPDDPDGLLDGLDGVFVETEVWLDQDDPDAIERVRNLAYEVSLGAWVTDNHRDLVDDEFAAIERGLYGGALAVLLLTAASLVVSTVEQLRERRRLLSILVAYGTPRGVLARSVLWQTLLPVAAGVTLAAVTGIGLGAVLQAMADTDVAVQWPAVAGFGAAGAAVILFATLASMPVLWRMMRPAGLRSE